MNVSSALGYFDQDDSCSSSCIRTTESEMSLCERCRVGRLREIRRQRNALCCFQGYKWQKRGNINRCGDDSEGEVAEAEAEEGEGEGEEDGQGLSTMGVY